MQVTGWVMGGVNGSVLGGSPIRGMVPARLEGYRSRLLLPIVVVSPLQGPQHRAADNHTRDGTRRTSRPGPGRGAARAGPRPRPRRCRPDEQRPRDPELVEGAVIVFRDVTEEQLRNELLVQSGKLAAIGELAAGA